MSFTYTSPDITKISSEELQKEIERRSKIHKFNIDNVEFELTLEQIVLLQKKLDSINPPKNLWNEYMNREVYPQKDITPTPYPHPRFKDPYVDPKYPGYNEPITCDNDQWPQVRNYKK